MIVHCYIFTYLNLTTCVFIYKFITAQKMKFSINDFFSKCDQIRRFLQCISRSYFQKSQKYVKEKVRQWVKDTPNREVDSCKKAKESK